ncbi:tRNA dihydrouridine synthase [Mucisphaera calidilacus]|uniref:tRNA-dihydrouridine synthase n=1 Tax=Mucisphaera calidilacus TaxID=2527982 RepID=A0A518BW48_9BACT|nr:tRNA-dihydrouridine synthase [Mucisphaera calidilacus]QDU71187.1 tRNA-dihydrouridine synthase C [Mucisphaera calidilacus]
MFTPVPPLRIGSFEPASPLLLAPIAGYCDLAYRLVVRSVPGYQGHATLGLACTDLLCPQALLRETDKSLWLAATCPEDSPVCMQLYGRHPDTLAQAALWAVEHGATTVDLNMGCPVDKVTKKNGGSKLLTEPCLAIEIVQTLARTLRPHTVPLTVKIRLGWDENSLVSSDLVPKLADSGISALIVHGRTTVQKFRGEVSHSGILRVVEAVKRHHPEVAVIGNGDVKSPYDARLMIDKTGCDGVMIGREALRRPWIFREANFYMSTGTLPPPLTRRARAQLVLDHFENVVRLRDERVALNTIRSRMSWYSAHIQPWPTLRRDVQKLRSANEFRDFWAAGVERYIEPEPVSAA